MKSIWRVIALGLVISSVLISQSNSPIAAQEGEEDDPNVVAVQSATVVHNEDQFTFVIDGQQLDGCEFELEAEATWQSDTVLFIDIVRVENESGDVTCSSERPTFSIELVVDGYEPPAEDEDIVGDDEDTEAMEDEAAFPIVTVKINDFLGQFPLVEVETEDGPDITAVPIVQVTASEVILDEVNIEFDEETEEYLLSVNGSFPEGCEAPVIVYQQQDEQAHTVEIFRPIEMDAICPAIFLTYEDTIVLKGEFLGIMTIDVNGIPIIYDADNNIQIGDDSMTRVPTVIDDVSVRVLESFPPQVVLSITGYQPDSCQFPVQVDTSVDDNMITVEIYRELPPNVRCAEAIVPYETTINLGSFDPGDYVIDVNGTIIEITL